MFSAPLDGHLLADSGYGLSPTLLVPYLNSVGPEQIRFNEALLATRVRIKQYNGILKNRFGCLLNKLCMTPTKAAEVITACVILNNIAWKWADLGGDLSDDSDDDGGPLTFFCTDVL